MSVKGCVALCCLALALPAMSEPLSGIHVNGRGEVMVEPDIARMTLQVTRQGRDANALKAELDGVTAAVLKLTDRLKVKRKDVTAALVNIHPNRVYSNNKQTIDGVVATRTIAVTLRDIDQTGGLINGALELGINNISGVQLDTSERRSLEQQALALAIEDAKEEAQRIAKAFDVRVMGVLNVQASSSQPRPMMHARAAMESSDSSESFNPGEIAITRDVQATFAIGGQ